MIEYAKEKNIALHCSTHGNFLNFDEAKAERLVDSGLDTLIFGVDGATQETYSQYRRGGNLHKVLDNIRTIVRIKKAKGAAHPRLTLRFVVMRHNEHETPLMHKLAEELEVDFLSFKTVNMPLPHGESLDSSWSPESKRYQRYEYHTESHARKQRPFRCMRPWKRITLQARGEIISCDQDYKNTYTFGNINDGQSTRAIWKNGIAAAFRKTFNLGWNGYYHCQDCQYKDQVAGDSTIEITPLKP
jgi:radical SAM protein with 4Fe4S-binding SPASM domain